MSLRDLLYVKAGGSGGGSGSGSALIVIADNEGVLNKTWAEMFTAAKTMPVILVGDYGTVLSADMLTEASSLNGEFSVGFGYGNVLTRYIATAEDGYPTVV